MRRRGRLPGILGRRFALGERTERDEVLPADPSVAESPQAGLVTGASPPTNTGPAAPDECLRAIGDFRVVREIGRGGMGVVYEAEQVSMRRRVALKVLYPSFTLSPKAVERFRREAHAAGRLHHTNIVPVYAMGEEDGTSFFAMEWVRGATLDRVIADLRKTAGRGPAGETAPQDAAADAPTETGPATTPWRSLGATTGGRGHYARIARTFAGVADALASAHAAGVVHRDVKPSNLILDTEGTLKVMDFGLALVEGEGTLTVTGAMLGTPAYMSPEQASGGRTFVDGHTDVYSLGATLYEVLTLEPAIATRDLRAMVTRILLTDPPRPRTLDRHIPVDLEAIVLKAMEKNPRQRYATASDFSRDLAAFAEGGTIRARRVGPVGRTLRRIKRHPTRFALVGAVAGLLVLGGALATSAARGAAERRTAQYDALCLEAEETASWGLTWRSPGLLVTTEEHSTNRILSRAISIDPDRPEAWFARAICCAGRTPQERIADLDAARERGLGARTHHVARSLLLRMSQRFDEAAREDVAAAAAPESGRPEDAYFEGRLHAARGDREQAIVRLTAAIDAHPSPFVRTEALLSRSMARESQGDLARAIEDLAALGSHRSLGIRARLASLWRRARHAETAEAEFETILADLRRRGAPEPWGQFCGALRSLDEKAWLDRASLEAVGLHPDSPISWTWRAAHYQLQGKHEDRLHCAERALSYLPRETFLLLRKGLALLELNRPQDALIEFDHVLRIAPDDLEAVRARATALHAMDKDAEAESTLRTFARTWTRDADAWNILGIFLYAKLHAYDRAAEAFEEAVRMNPGFADYHYNLGNALAARVAPQSRELTADERGLLEAAAAKYAEAIRLDPGKAGYHDNLGVLWARLGESDKALEHQRTAVRMHPEDALARFNLATVLERTDPVGAAEAYREAFRLDPSRSDAAANLAGLYLGAGDLDGAIAQATAAVEAATAHGSPREALGVAHNTLGLAHLRRGEVDLAIAEFTASLEAVSTDGLVRANLGLALLQAGRADEALVALRQALRDGREVASTWNEIGNALDATGDKAGSLEAYERALAVDDAFGAAWVNKGRRLWEKGEKRQAIEAYQQAVDLCPENGNARNALGYALLNSDRVEDAIAHFVAAAKADPGARNPPWNLGTAYALLQRYEEALPHLRRGLELTPADDPGRSAIERQLRRCERHAIAARALNEMADGAAQPTDGTVLGSMMEVAYARNAHAQAAELGRAAFAADPTLVADLDADLRYNAACAAALAGCGRGEGAAALDATARARWRTQALAWLQEDLAAWSARLEGPEPDARTRTRKALDHWLVDPDFAPLRDGPPPGELGADERAAWDAFWARVRTLR